MIKKVSIIPKLKFKGNEYLLINGDGNRNEGAIATQEQWKNFECSFAHLEFDGRILRHGIVIGNRSDIEWLDIDAEIIEDKKLLIE